MPLTQASGAKYHSRFDRVGAADGAPVLAAEASLAPLSTVLARSLLRLAKGDDAAAAPLAEDVAADPAVVGELIECLTLDFSCSLVQRHLNLTQGEIRSYMAGHPMSARSGPQAGGPPTLYTSVYFPLKYYPQQVSLLERFVRNFLANATSPSGPFPSPPSS